MLPVPPHQTREFIHAEDVARGMMAALERGEDRGVYNLGTHGATCVPLHSLISLIQRVTGMEHKRVVFESDKDKDWGDERRWSDCSRMHALGWTHQHDLERIVTDVVEYYEEEKRKEEQWQKNQQEYEHARKPV